MTIAIMQPYFFPYIGYFQLMRAADEFVVYDNIEFTKKGWINRNRILLNGADTLITLPIRKDSDFLDVRERFLADTWSTSRTKMLNLIKEAYRRAPQFHEVFPLIEKCISYEDSNLFNFIFHSMNQVRSFLRMETPLVVSSSIPIDHELKAGKKVMAICAARNATTYMNPIGGLKLYSEKEFKANNIDLQFLKANDVTYQQLNASFVPSLSIIDVLMFNDVAATRSLLREYTIS